MSSLRQRASRGLRAFYHNHFHKRFKLWRVRLREEGYLRQLRSKQEAQIVVNYSRAQDSLLDSLCNRYGSDKGGNSRTEHPYPWKHHTYSDVLSLLFEPNRHQVKLVFECGIGTNNISFPANMGARGIPGASLRVWRDYFPHSEVFGADIDESVLFEEERIKTFSLDQRNPNSVADMWRRIGRSGFDLMIDDGLHVFEAGKTLFLGSIDQLAQNGTYIIEDVLHEDMLRYMDFFSDSDYRVDFFSLLRPRERRYVPMRDNQMIVIRHPQSA
jgi:hypothetical protein